MGLRPGRCYRRHHRPYTRISIRRPRRSYVKGVPKPKITAFEYGQKGNYEKVLYLIANDTIQIRHNSLDSARVTTVQTLEKLVGKAGYFFKVRVFPHHVIRENPMATGAGADRFQQGMRQSFGRPIGTAAQVRSGQKIMEIRVNSPYIVGAKKAFLAAIHKLPTTCEITVEDLK